MMLSVQFGTGQSPQNPNSKGFRKVFIPGPGNPRLKKPSLVYTPLSGSQIPHPTGDYYTVKARRTYGDQQYETWGIGSTAEEALHNAESSEPHLIRKWPADLPISTTQRIRLFR